MKFETNILGLIILAILAGYLVTKLNFNQAIFLEGEDD